jgi:antitoxin MazE
MMELKVSKIGNSRGIRLPSALLKRYQIEDKVLVEEGDDSFTLRPKRTRKFSWGETAAEMAKSRENWNDLEATVADGLDSL